jgi:hypothetical protein
MLPVLLAFALAVPSQASSPREILKGSYLFHQCQAAVREDSRDAVGAAACLAYLEGYIDGKTFDKNGPCAENASYGEIARVYVAYMEKHPELMDRDRRIGVMFALGAAYPCPVIGNGK